MIELPYYSSQGQNVINANAEQVNLNYYSNTQVVEDLCRDANILLNLLLRDLKIESTSDESVNSIISQFKAEMTSNKPNSGDKIVKTFCEYISKIPGINNFVLIGDKTIETEECESHYEIFCRLNPPSDSNSDIEFLLNDVTRTKIKEKQNAEFKYKSLFLSKVAHEFKNPLICISELINNLFEGLSHPGETYKKDFQANLNQIKSLSNFLLVLVKDLNYFSQIHMEKSAVFESKETNLRDIINFCKDITESLIKKANKTAGVEFSVVIDRNVPFVILSDEWRLKQILINLLSNAVKFTLYGKITLEVTKYAPGKLKFLVKDTGTGMKEETKENLFKPFQIGGGNSNDLGSGLGLSIVYELTSKMGEPVQFSSEDQKGSSFWFFLEDNSDQINNSLYSPRSKETRKADINLYKTNIPVSFLDSNHDSSNNQSLISIGFKKPPRSSSKFYDVNNINININNTNYITNFENNKKVAKNFNLNSNKFTLADFVQNDINLSLLRNEGEINNNKTLGGNILNIIVADDESLTRQSAVRSLQAASNELRIRINLIESEDGIETIYLVYKCIKQGIRISLIFSDQQMHFMKGSDSSHYINSVIMEKNMSPIPFYLVTAYHGTLIENNIRDTVTEILPKPLNKITVSNIIKRYSNAE